MRTSHPIHRSHPVARMIAIIAFATIASMSIIPSMLASGIAIEQGIAYNDGLLYDLNLTKIEFEENDIDTHMLESYISSIEGLVLAEDYDEADKVGDEAKSFSQRVLDLKGEIEAAKYCVISGCDEAGKYADEALFELGTGNFEAAEALKNSSMDKKGELYSRKKQELITLLVSSNNGSGENRDDGNSDDGIGIDNKNYGQRKKNELIAFADSIRNNETQKLLFFEQEVGLFIKSEESLTKTARLSEEYRRLGGKNRLDDGIEEMNLNLELGNYERIAVMERELANTFFLANESARLIEYALERGYGVDELALLSEAKTAFEEERFEDSLELAKKAIDSGEKEISSSMFLARMTDDRSGKTLRFLSEHVVAILVLAAISAGVAIKAYPAIILWLARRRITRLNNKIVMKNNMVIDLQKKHYVENKISRRLYQSLLLKHQKEIVDMKEKIAFTQAYIQNNGKAHGQTDSKTDEKTKPEKMPALEKPVEGMKR